MPARDDEYDGTGPGGARPGYSGTGDARPDRSRYGGRERDDVRPGGVASGATGHTGRLPGDAPSGGSTPGDAGFDCSAPGDAGFDGTGPGDEGDGIRYGGVDALMTAILEDDGDASGVLPERARRDPAFTAARDAAAADLVLLRQQLGLIGEALAAPVEVTQAETTEAEPTAGGAEAGAPPGRDGAVRPGSGPQTAGRPQAQGRRRDGVAATGTGRQSGPGPRGSGPETAPPRPAPHPPLRPRGDHPPHTPEPAHGPRVRPASERPRPTPRRPRRPLGAALGVLVAAAAATVVLGVGWLVAQPGGGVGGADDKSAAQSDSAAKEAGDTAFGSPRRLACARLVAEGTVAAVEPVPGRDHERVTLEVTRSYKGDGTSEVTFPYERDAGPRLRAGDEVLVGLPSDGDFPDAVVTGERAIAHERAGILAALPASRTLPCG
ncbi:hypothetical protein ACFYOV_15830 [Streptomyces sp. NPDC005931]|uniref:hypothetical protein n=1 Tax=Streptomyces sp. NPDC005931 TaxID=3364737 RepID=UPI0036CB3AC1